MMKHFHVSDEGNKDCWGISAAGSLNIHTCTRLLEVYLIICAEDLKRHTKGIVDISILPIVAERVLVTTNTIDGNQSVFNNVA